MIRQCSMCKDFKFWFRFCLRLGLDRTSICRKCSRKLLNDALKPYVLEVDK